MCSNHVAFDFIHHCVEHQVIVVINHGSPGNPISGAWECMRHSSIHGELSIAMFPGG